MEFLFLFPNPYFLCRGVKGVIISQLRQIALISPMSLYYETLVKIMVFHFLLHINISFVEAACATELLNNLKSMALFRECLIADLGPKLDLTLYKSIK